MSSKQIPKVNIIDFKMVQTKQDEFNSHMHKLEEIQAAVPETAHPSLSAIQPWLLLSPWIPLITKSRKISLSGFVTIHLKPLFCETLQRVSPSIITTERINASDAEDLVDTFSGKTKCSKAFVGGQRWFARLDACSLKDSVYQSVSGAGSLDFGYLPCVSLQQLIYRLASSARAIDAITSLRACGEEVKLFLLPWDDSMKTELEYRIFCPPPQVNSKGNELRISAISQYKWHAPYYESDPSKVKEIACCVFEGACDLFTQINETIREDPESKLAETGFTFDVVTDEDGRNVRLIELNIFRAMTGCGSCTYHWIQDARVLYGCEKDVEFRVATG